MSMVTKLLGAERSQCRLNLPADQPHFTIHHRAARTQLFSTGYSVKNRLIVMKTIRKVVSVLFVLQTLAYGEFFKFATVQ